MASPVQAVEDELGVQAGHHELHRDRVHGQAPGYGSTSMGSKFMNTVFKVLTSGGSRQLRDKMSAELVNGRFDIMVFICVYSRTAT